MEMLRAFLLLLHLQCLTSCDQQQYLPPLRPVPVGVRCPALNGLSQPENQPMLGFTHLLLRPPPESGSPGTDRLCLGKSGRMGAGRLHAADPPPPSRLGNKLKSMCLSGRGNSTAPWTLVWRRSQHGTEQGLARDGSSEGARLNGAVSGISQA